jgi:translation elongation factor EF-Ts
MHVCAMAPTSVNNEDGLGEETSLMKQSFIKNADLTVEQRIQAAVQKFGENVNIIRFSRYSIA